MLENCETESQVAVRVKVSVEESGDHRPDSEAGDENSA